MISRFFLSAIILLSFTTISLSQEEFNTTSVTIFKNGAALIEKSANLNLNGNTAIINNLPFTIGSQTQNFITAGTIQFLSAKNEIVETRVYPNYMKLVFEKASESEIVKLSYVQAGLRWIPYYLIQLNGDGSALLKLDVTLLNQIEDINDATINFAIGKPFFPYLNHHSPLIHSHEANSNYGANRNYNDFVVLGYGSKSNENTNSSNHDSFEEAGWYEDLFIYPKNNLSLKKNENLKLNLLRTKISYQDVYKVTVNSNRNIVNYQGFISNLTKSENIIQHSIKFKNSSHFPLTTGVVHFQGLSGDRIKFVSQGLLNYTNVHEDCEIQLSASPEIVVEDNDFEVSRVILSGMQELTVRSEINIFNYKSKPIDLVVNRDIVGVLLESDKNWDVNKLMTTSFLNNESNDVTWKIHVPAKGEESINYTYKILVEKQ